MTVSRTAASEEIIFMNVDFPSDAVELFATKTIDLAA
jgi:hypothetical protein